MRKTSAVLCLLLLLQQANGRNTALQRVIVKFKNSVSYTVDYKANKFLLKKQYLGVRLLQKSLTRIISLIPQEAKKTRKLASSNLLQNIHFLQFNNQQTLSSLISQLQKTGLFEYVEEDQEGSSSGIRTQSPGDALFYRQWGLHNDGSFDTQAKPGADIDIERAWAITTGNKATIVSILDTGLKLDHPEFSGRLWVNTGEIPGNGKDDDKNGYIDDINGWDWANDDKDPSDDYGHGTNVAGILAATGDNHIGYAGINWKCRIMVGKVLDGNNTGYYSWWISGIYYAVANGARVINMSVGGSGYSDALKDACDFAYKNNVLVVACMMNTNSNTIYYPAGFESTLAVGATTVNDYRANPFSWGGGSNYGPHIDMVAPGNIIYGPDYKSDNNYNVAWSGTSQATPMVAGVASLLFGQNPDATINEVKTTLQSTAQDTIGNPAEDKTGFDDYMGHGRLNAYLAVKEMSTYYFEGNGNWSNAGNWKNKKMPPANLPAGFEIEINPSANKKECMLDVNQRLAPGAKLTIKPGSHLRIAGGVIIKQ